MEKKEFICIVCPKGCKINVLLDDSNIVSIEENNCKKGKEYAKNEALNPKRLVFTTVKLRNGEFDMLPVRSKKAVSKEIVKGVMRSLAFITRDAPVKIGDLIVENILNTGVDIIASRSIGVKQSE